MRFLLVMGSCILLANCSASPASNENAGDFPEGEVTFPGAEGQYGYVTAYNFGELEYSGTHFEIIRGSNPISNFQGHEPCQLMIDPTSVQPAYNSVTLPGNDGKLFDICSLIGPLVTMFPYNGTKDVNAQHPNGGNVTMLYGSQGEFEGVIMKGPEFGEVAFFKEDLRGQLGYPELEQPRRFID